MSKYSEKSLTEKRIDILNNKKYSYKLRVTTYLQSKTKDVFLNDCISKKRIEAATAKEIIEIHYAIINELPKQASYMDFKELKKYLLEKIKLK